MCVVSGQQRSRMLATLFKDERCQQLAAYGILEKMYLDRIIRGNQLQEFAAMLMPHQKATTADGKRRKQEGSGWKGSLQTETAAPPSWERQENTVNLQPTIQNVGL